MFLSLVFFPIYFFSKSRHLQFFPHISNHFFPFGFVYCFLCFYSSAIVHKSDFSLKKPFPYYKRQYIPRQSFLYSFLHSLCTTSPHTTSLSGFIQMTDRYILACLVRTSKIFFIYLNIDFVSFDQHYCVALLQRYSHKRQQNVI